VGWIRAEADFVSLEALIARIRADGEATKAALALPRLAATRADPFLLPGGGGDGSGGL
jgi:riboflavin kinase